MWITNLSHREKRCIIFSENIKLWDIDLLVLRSLLLLKQFYWRQCSFLQCLQKLKEAAKKQWGFGGGGFLAVVHGAKWLLAVDMYA